MNHDVEELSIVAWRAASALNISIGEDCPTEFVSMVLLNFVLNEDSPYSGKVREQCIKIFQTNAEQNRYTGLKHSGATKDPLSAVEQVITETLDQIAKQATAELGFIENLVNNAEKIPSWIKNFRRNTAAKNILEERFHSHIYTVSRLLGRNHFNISRSKLEAFQEEVKTQLQHKNAMDVQWDDDEFNQRVIQNNTMFIQSVEQAFVEALEGAKNVSETDKQTAQTNVKSVLNKYKNDVEEMLQGNLIEKSAQTRSQYVTRLKIQTAEVALKNYRRSI